MRGRGGSLGTGEMRPALGPFPLNHHLGPCCHPQVVRDVDEVARPELELLDTALDPHHLNVSFEPITICTTSLSIEHTIIQNMDMRSKKYTAKDYSLVSGLRRRMMVSRAAGQGTGKTGQKRRVGGPATCGTKHRHRSNRRANGYSRDHGYSGYVELEEQKTERGDKERIDSWTRRARAEAIY